MTRRRTVETVCALMIGLMLAWAASRALGYALEPPEIRNYVPGKPLFDRPVTEEYAREVSAELREKIDREGVIRRFDAAHSFPVIVATDLLAFLLDPINLAMAIVFSLLARFAIRRFTTGLA